MSSDDSPAVGPEPQEAEAHAAPPASRPPSTVAPAFGPPGDSSVTSPYAPAFDFWEEPEEQPAPPASPPDAARHITLVHAPSIRTRRDDFTISEERPRRSGWVLGILFGVLLGIWAFVPVRFTLLSQLYFGLIEDTAPWLRSLDTQHTRREAPRLDAIAGSAPNDYLLQVGRATALATAGGLRSASTLLPQGRQAAAEDTESTLLRLTVLGRDFPQAPGAYAHLIRYMMVERVRIERAELAPPTTGDTPPPHTLPARLKDVRLMEWALASGERLDPDNAFWPMMRAVTYFSVLRDDEALEQLRRAGQKARWDAYLYEEVLGEWRLYTLAYGDHGAAQKIGPLSLLAFPHLGEMRKAGAMARWLADAEERAKHPQEALRIRRAIARAGFLLRERAAWSYEALYGTDLLLLATTDGTYAPDTGDHATLWRQRAQRYLKLLRRWKHPAEASWIEEQIEASCQLRNRIDRVRFDSSFPGIPPGIPLLALFRSWVTGVSLLQQMAGIGTLGALAWLLPRVAQRPSLQRRLWLYLGLLSLLAICGSALLLWTGAPSPRVAGLFLSAAMCFLVVLIAEIQTRWMRVRRERTGDVWDEAETGWQLAHSLWTLALLLPLGLLALFVLRDWLPSLHPVAVLLSSLLTNAAIITPLETLQLAFLALALPLSVVLLIVLHALWRRWPLLPTLLVALRGLCLPALLSLTLCYLMLLNQTLRLDSEASHAINEAAQNDLQWVLTHDEESAELP